MIAGYEGDCMGLEKGNIVLDVGLDSVATGRLVKGKWMRLHGKGERSEHYHCIAAQVAMRMTYLSTWFSEFSNEVFQLYSNYIYRLCKLLMLCCLIPHKLQ